MTSTRETIPQSIRRRARSVFRPRDVADTYRHNPAAELARLERNGHVVAVARGYYALVPDEFAGSTNWRPSIEGIALGIAQADYGRSDACLSGISAARALGGVPRALGSAVVSVPTRRRPISSVSGMIHFWLRTVASLDLEAVRTDLPVGRATSVEQTILDLGDRPLLGGVTPDTVSEAIHSLASRADWRRVHQLSVVQGSSSAYARAVWSAGVLAPEAPSPPYRSHRLLSFGLRSAGDLPRRAFGISDD